MSNRTLHGASLLRCAQWVPLWFFLLPIIGSAACGAETSAPAAQEDGGTDGGTDPVGEGQKAALDACGFAEPCPAGSYSFLLMPESARTCMLDALAGGQPVHLSIRNVADGGGDCGADHEIYVGSDGTVIVWRRYDSDCSAGVNYLYELVRCTLAARSSFTNCGAPPTMPPDPCDWGLWYSNCMPLDAPFCS